MATGGGLSRAPIAVAVLLLVTSLPALADRTTVHVQDEDTLLLGDPSGQAEIHVEQELLGQHADVGTYKEYAFTIESSDNRLDVDLGYDPGPVATTGPCLKANDLDLFVQGPGWSRSYPGCDDGELTILANGVPTGEYTVRVEAAQGSTLCIPDELSSPCSAPGIEYQLEIRVWSLG